MPNNGLCMTGILQGLKTLELGNFDNLIVRTEVITILDNALEMANILVKPNIESQYTHLYYTWSLFWYVDYSKCYPLIDTLRRETVFKALDIQGLDLDIIDKFKVKRYIDVNLEALLGYTREETNLSESQGYS